MEQKKDQVHVKKSSSQGKFAAKSSKANLDESDSGEEDDHFEEFVSWRKKR